MRVLFGSAGSRGDVMPILEIAGEIQARGHDVHVFLPRQFEPEASRRGLCTSAFQTDSQALMGSLDSGWRSAKQILEWCRQSMHDQFDVLLPAAREADALVTMVNEMGAPSIAAYHGIPHFRVCCVPSLPGAQPPAVQPVMRLPTPLNWFLWQGVELSTQLIFRRPLNARRKTLGLPPIGRFCDHLATRSHSLLAMDPVLLPPDRGWRYPYAYVGYPFGGDDGPLPEDVEDFLAAGPPPIYLGFGSVNLPDPKRTTRIILGAVSRMGCRAVLARGWTGLGEGATLPPKVLLVGDTPHRALFPRMAGIVHHGGSGTTHNAARAGVPQAIVPHMLDQFFWGQRVFDLGLGPRPVPEARLTEEKLVRILRALLAPTHRHQARVVAGLMRQDGVSAVADAVERITRPREARAPQARPEGYPRPAHVTSQAAFAR